MSLMSVLVTMIDELQVPTQVAGTSDVLSDGMVRRLLDLYKSNYDKLAGARNNRDKAKWWEKLCQEFNTEFNCDFSKERLRNKINNLKTKLKKVQDHNNVSGAGRANIKMREDLLDAFGDSPSVQGPKTVSVAGLEGKQPEVPETQSPDSEKTAAGKHKRSYRSASEKVLAIIERNEELAEEREHEREKRRKQMHEEKENRREEMEQSRKKDNEEKERNKERRHNERMAVAEGILSALNRLADKL